MSSTSTPESRTRVGSSTAVSDDSPQSGQVAGLRASDADRHLVVTQLQDAVARGLLTPDEGSQRMATAYHARYLGDLPPLTADLPAPPPVATAPTPAGWRALLALLWVQLRLLIAGSGTARPSRRRLAAVGGIALVAVVVLVLGTWTLHGSFDGPHGRAGGFDGR